MRLSHRRRADHPLGELQKEAPGRDEDPDLIPGVRDRVHARLAAMGVPDEKVVSYVAGVTQRAAQSVRRWFHATDPGLPDLQSFVRLCAGLGCTPDELIGLSGRSAKDAGRCAETVQVADCVQAITDTLTGRGSLGVPMRVPGDEMAPRLKAGDWVFVDMTATRLAGNGIYALTCDGRLLIRRVEQRIDTGMVLICDNRAYRDQEWTWTTSAARCRVKVLGKVHGSIGARLL